MPIFTMSGPFRLTDDMLARSLPKHRTAGVFALGRFNRRGALEPVQYVGRADVDLAADIRRYIGTYEGFLFERASSARDAFLMECELFHRFRLIDNHQHPVPPPLSGVRCPICAQGAVADDS